MGLSKGWKGCSKGFSEGKTQGKSQGANMPAEDNSVLPNSFTHIYIILPKGVHIGPPKMQRWFRIDLPKIHKFRIREREREFISVISGTQ